MRKPMFLLLWIIASLGSYAQQYSADKVVAKDQIVIRGKPIIGLLQSSPDSSFLIGDSVILTSRAVKEYIDKRLAACGCGGGSSVPVALSISGQPTSASVNVGQNASFSVTAAGGTVPYSYQWRKGATNISGATSAAYTLTNIQFADSGSYRVTVTDGVNASVVSNVGYLTVNSPPSAITVSWAYTSTDPYVNSTTVPSVTYGGSQNITHNAVLSFYLPQAATNSFLVFKVPATESIKTLWYSTALNQGQIPDQGFRAAYTVGGFTYYVTREALAFDYTQPIVLQ